ncbi:tetratricopeptide repeat protein [Phytohabitans sp. LJ34]|uniref:AfsR/SARP family transcriptional regulator n=1 Tax=Phytohabitans sp. LJ34 TaxID=3452217 RepID=UPI003F8B20CA
MRYHVLGPVGVHRDGGGVPLGGPKPRTVLAALLLNAGRVVSERRLVAMVWGDDPPPSVRGQLHTHVSTLRKLLGADVIARRPPGYLIAVQPGELDLDAADDALARARADAARGRARDAAPGLRAALALWTGPVLGGVTEPLLAHEGPALRERRLVVLEELFEAELDAGHHAGILGELLEAAREHPFRERLHAQSMLALHRCGRTAEALEMYASAHDRLIAELGVEPGRLLREAQGRILRGDEPPAGPDVPRQLPADLATFVGRAAELSDLDGLRGPGARVAAIVGTAGVGKTSLAVRWAHRARAEFPDGQLYVNLRGFEPAGTAVDPADAVRGLLDALAVPAERIPTGLEERAGLYRSLLADRRMLVVLDNARDCDQVRPLLPGTGGCLALVTSRADLTGLVAEGAAPLRLELLSDGEAREMLARRLGADRVAAEPGAVDEIVAASARLPLALAIVAARAATHPTFPLAAIAGELRELDDFDGVRTVFASSYRMLGPDTARVFRLLGLHPGPDVSAATVASVAGIPVRAARRAVAELTRAHLLAEPSPGRYTSHDLLRGYAAELAERDEPAAERQAALRRTLDHYLHTAWAADRLLIPQRDPIELAPAHPGVTPEELPDQRRALAWFQAEHRNLAALIQRVPAGQDTHTWQLAWTLATFFDRQGHWQDYVAAHRVALDATRRLGDTRGQAHTHRNLGRAFGRLARFDEAQVHLERALDRYRACGDTVGQAHAHGNLSWVLEQRGRYADALTHAGRALDLYRAAGDKAMQANALNTVGWQHALLGDHDAALAHCEQALALLQSLGDRFGEAVTWDSVGYVHQHRGDHARAADAYRRAVDMFHEVADRLNEARTLTRLGDTQGEAGQPDGARETWRRALEILDDLGHPSADDVRARLRPTPVAAA